ncbi:MAG: metal ABC transporter permease [ANME-2 cluster archaeon]|nr:metal ABC transporter permease [ANME-2 cluster archaeon]MBC2701850.1 metal ABC transporter permease [ANME-2 cluster archaeon]MBC2707315.1 metal ABC transporter permease [ANME-2 cluster archaeon]MBC2747174.1 metal ABC transporter permease [ANME-2 cluster archaeon]MBC2761724.1 metal ABC transporter permease [ANME-2 cluster archaeon]
MMELLQYEFIRNAIMAGILASISCGIIGVYVVVKRIVFISGGIAHASFGGIGLGYYLGINPILGVLPFSIASALSMGWVSKRSRLPEDTAIGILWAMGMSIGIILVSLTPGYAPDLMTYLFGNILTVPFSDIVLMLVLDAIIILVVYSFYKEFLALCFDEEFATVRGVHAERLYLILLCLIALTIVVLIRVVGIILVIALLTIPAAMSRQFTSNLKKMMMLSILFGAVFSSGGIWLSYLFDVPSGATIVLVMSVVYLLYSLVKGISS